MIRASLVLVLGLVLTIPAVAQPDIPAGGQPGGFQPGAGKGGKGGGKAGGGFQPGGAGPGGAFQPGGGGWAGGGAPVNAPEVDFITKLGVHRKANVVSIAPYGPQAQQIGWQGGVKGGKGF